MISLYNLNSILRLRKIGNIVKPMMVVFLPASPPASTQWSDRGESLGGNFGVIGENYGF